MKFQLVSNTTEFLDRKGFDTCEYIGGCFDIAAKRERLLLLKVLQNIDSFQRGQAKDLKILSKTLPAKPFILGERSRRDRLENDVIYERFGIPALTLPTFKSVLSADYPEKIKTRGGKIGRINSDKLKKSRKERGMTQSELADRAGVSQKNISEHERGLENISFSMLENLETILDRNLTKNIDPFDFDFEEVDEKTRGKNDIDIELKRVGFKTVRTSRAPPELLASDDKTFMSRSGTDVKKVKKFTKPLKEFSELSGSPAFLVLKEKKEVKELPVITRDELEGMEEPEEVEEKVNE